MQPLVPAQTKGVADEEEKEKCEEISQLANKTVVCFVTVALEVP